MVYRLDRQEIAGSLGDLGTILPLAIGMVIINGLNPLGIFLSVGIFYILSGLYFGVTLSVEPMKVISAYAIATGIPVLQLTASGLLIGIILLIIGGSGAITFLGRYVPRSTIRGVQLSTGVLLISQGVRLIMGTSTFQALHQTAEPFLQIQNIGLIPLSIILGITLAVITLLLIDNKKIPAAIVVVLAGLITGLILGNFNILEKIDVGLHLPQFFPFGFPSIGDSASALLILALPQIPMTLGNAVIATTDLSRQYFGDASKKVTYKSLCVSMALANFFSFLFGGMPMCHGAGGLASRYRFGARTAGSNLFIGAVLILLALLFGDNVLYIFYLLPMSALGVLLFFAGSQLGLTILDINDRKSLFVVLTILGITLASNLAIGFISGIALAYALRSEKIII